MNRPTLTKEQRKRYLNEISELAMKKYHKVSYLSGCDKDEQVGCGVIDLVDIRYFTKLSLEIDDHATGLISHYNLND